MAVDAFLARKMGFLDISRVVEETLTALGGSEPSLIAKTPSSFDDVRAVDQAARSAAQRIAVRLAAA